MPLLFAAAPHSTYEPILGQPSNSDIVKITDVLSEALYQIPFDDEKGVHNLVGLIQDKESYTTDYKEAFPSPKKPGIYDPIITEGTKDSIRAQKEAIHKAKRQDFKFVTAAERGVRNFIIAVVADTYIRDLRSAKYFYTKVKPKAISNPKICLPTFSRCAVAFTPSTSLPSKKRCTTPQR